MRHLWESHPGEWHYAPHRYEFTTYTQGVGGVLTPAGVRRTQRPHESWQSAAIELGLQCDNLADRLLHE
jgi:hypothetical protein